MHTCSHHDTHAHIQVFLTIQIHVICAVIEIMNKMWQHICLWNVFMCGLAILYIILCALQCTCNCSYTVQQEDTQNSTNSRKVYFCNMSINIPSYYWPHFVNNVSCAANIEYRVSCRLCITFSAIIIMHLCKLRTYTYIQWYHCTNIATIFKSNMTLEWMLSHLHCYYHICICCQESLACTCPMNV